MKTRTLMISLLTTALFLPALPALADSGAASDGRANTVAEGREHAKGEHKKGDHKRPEFPMKGDAFLEHVQKRTTHMRDKITKRLDNKKVTAENRAAILKAFDAGAANVKTAASKAAADGTVTQEEAKTVREVSKTERKKLRDLLPGKGKKGEKADNGRRGKRGQAPA